MVKEIGGVKITKGLGILEEIIYIWIKAVRTNSWTLEKASMFLSVKLFYIERVTTFYKN